MSHRKTKRLKMCQLFPLSINKMRFIRAHKSPGTCSCTGCQLSIINNIIISFLRICTTGKRWHQTPFTREHFNLKATFHSRVYINRDHRALFEDNNLKTTQACCQVEWLRGFSKDSGPLEQVSIYIRVYFREICIQYERTNFIERLGKWPFSQCSLPNLVLPYMYFCTVNY